jgi:phosphate-selective porin
MTKRHLLLAAPLALLAACGGQYNVTAGTATAGFAADNCNIVPLFVPPTPPIDVAVSGTTANFDLKGGQTLPQFKTTATITGNQIDHVTDANFETAVGTACVFVTRVRVNGDITANNAMHLVARYDIATKAGTTCTLVDVDAKVLPCTSEVDFLATKVP